MVLYFVKKNLIPFATLSNSEHLFNLNGFVCNMFATHRFQMHRHTEE